ncbi:MAG: MerR family transcriptional regulator [Ruminococcaceae bacterium]|nr:MerR family transcriptional regulator [Oscillospiraceae bacterium]
MKINELAKISHVNPETIRMYRNRGLLRPAREENGYFEYSWDDLQNLLYIRKLRGLNLPLDTIAYTYAHPDADDIVAGFQRECDNLSAQIDELCRRRFMLEVTTEHYRSYRENLRGVMPVEVPDDRYDVPFGNGAADRAPDEWLGNIDLFTQGLRIPAAYLCSGELPERVPVELTLGTYRPILEEHGVAVPKAASHLPGGLYLAAIVERRGDSIPGAQLRPLLDYARAHSYVPTGESTAFLFRVDRAKGGESFIYRLRVRVRDAAP